MMRLDTEIAVIGGGVIGLAIAIRLAAEHHEVTIVEPNEPGSGASYGNAGTIADYAIIPVGTPAVLRNLPSLLFDRDSPLSIRLAAIPALSPWLIQFARQSLPANARRNAAAIAALLVDAVPAWRELATELAAEDLLCRNGCLYLYDTKRSFAAAADEIALRKFHGVAQEILSPDEVARLEPRLPPSAGGGVFFPEAVNFLDPGELMRRMAQAAAAAGVRFVRNRAESLRRVSAGVDIALSGSEIRARTVVVAAGAHSRALAAQAGSRVPLETERGYHVEFDVETPPVTRPTCPTSRGFYLVPMAGRLRVAGTVELGGLSAPANPRRIALLAKGARTIFPDLGQPNRSWLGFRPSMPDSVPVIGPSSAGRDILFAFGHGHLGLSLAPVTARMIADVIGGRPEQDRLRPCSPDRFG